jgi:hypothetical protein
VAIRADERFADNPVALVRTDTLTIRTTGLPPYVVERLIDVLFSPQIHVNDAPEAWTFDGELPLDPTPATGRSVWLEFGLTRTVCRRSTYCG